MKIEINYIDKPKECGLPYTLVFKQEEPEDTLHTGIRRFSFSLSGEKLDELKVLIEAVRK